MAAPSHPDLKVAAATIEQEIPNELKESPPLEGVATLDRRFDELLAEVKMLQESRNKDFQNTLSRKDYLPVLPDAEYIHNFRSIRQAKLDELIKIESPRQSVSSSQQVSLELRDYWQVERATESINLLSTLRTFYAERAKEILEESFIIVSRWGKFKSLSVESTNSVQKYLKFLNDEYVDISARQERLEHAYIVRERQIEAEKAKREAEKVAAERRGLFQADESERHKLKIMAVAKEALKIKKQIEKEKREKAERDAKLLIEKERKDMNEIEVSDDLIDPGFEPADVVCYLRWTIMQNRLSKPLSTYTCRLATLAQSDRRDLLNDYRLIMDLMPGQQDETILEWYDGIELYLEHPPIKATKLEDFLIEFEILCGKFNIETSIGLEDGRPFAYEVDSNFNKLFVSQMAVNNICREPNSQPKLDYQNCPVLNPDEEPRLKHADWLDNNEFRATSQLWQEQQREKLRAMKELDFEVLCEYDLICCDQMDLVTPRLREAARKLWEGAAKKLGQTPSHGNGDTSSRNKPGEPSADFETKRIMPSFNLGMLLPDGRESLSIRNVLDTKKRQFGQILRANEEAIMIEEELQSVDPNRVSTSLNLIEPTVSTIFAEHEIMSYMQLRYLRLRQLRLVLRSQLNFMRSVERSITLGFKHIQELSSESTAEPIGGLPRSQLNRMKEFASMLNEASKMSQGDEKSKSNHFANSLSFIDDFRALSDEKIVVFDENSIPVLYDKALDDLNTIEREFLKAATIFINSGLTGKEAISISYVEELRYKMSDRKADTKDATYLNPGLDRTQLLLEIYSAEVKFQYAKIQAINAYLEMFNHAVDCSVKDFLRQEITNMLYQRPNIQFNAKYFSKSYAISTKAFDLRTSIILEVFSEILTQARDWASNFSSKMSSGAANEVSTIMTPIIAGLPYANHSFSPSVSLCHARVNIFLTEVIPALSEIINVQTSFRKIWDQLQQDIDIMKPPNSTTCTGITEMVVLKSMLKTWRELVSIGFMPSVRGRKAIGGLDNDTWIENPLLPDLILAEYYSPYENQTDKQIIPPVYPLTVYTDTQYAPKARDILRRVLRALALRNKIYYCWLQTELLRMCFDDQISQMGVKKAICAMRFSELRYDGPDAAETKMAEEQEDDYAADQAISFTSLESLSDAPTGKNPWKVGPLAISELDESCSMFDFSSIKTILKLLRPIQLQNMAKALKIQLLDKNWLLASVNMNNFLLYDLHGAILKDPKGITRGETQEPQKQKIRAKSARSNEPIAQSSYDVDYKLLVPSIIHRKKQMRRAMVSEFAKETRKLSREMSETDQEEAAFVIQHELIDWYFANMSEIVLEECERAEYTHIVTDLRRMASSHICGRVLFRMSKVQKNSDFFEHDNKTQSSSVDADGIVQIQEYIHTDLDGTEERLGQIWYIPHVTEALMGFGTHEKPPRSATDMTQKVFSNSQAYQRAGKVQRYLYELMKLVSTFSRFLCDNNRFIQSVKDLREADYIIATMNMLKKDLSYQGNPAEYSRVEAYLSTKWKIWFLRNRLALSSAAYALHIRVFPESYQVLLQQELLMSGSPDVHPARPILSCALNNSLKAPYTPIASLCSMAELDPEAKRIADNKVVELDDCMEQYLQATLLNFGENTEEVNKTQLDYLVSSLKLFVLRREFIRLYLNGSIIKTIEQAQDVMRIYKMRILVGAIRLYFKLGSRGNIMPTAILLRDEIVTSSYDMEFNRMSQAAFERCQVSVLANEILRQYTQHMLRQAKKYYDRLADERTGRLFKQYEYIELNAQNGDKHTGLRLSQDLYLQKSRIILSFVETLYKAAAEYAKERKALMQQTAVTTKIGFGKQHMAHQAALFGTADDSKAFQCTKEALSQAVIQLALDITKLCEQRMADQENFLASMIERCLYNLKTSEKTVAMLVDERSELLKSFSHNVRITSAQIASDIYTELGTLSVEVQELRKIRKAEERKLRNKIIDEYDDMVAELVMENHVIRNRFNEYRTNTVHEVLDIISGTKKEELTILYESPTVPNSLKQSITKTIQYEDILSSLKEDNHELQMTLLKVRSMYSIKEQSLRSSYEKRIRKLTQDNKIAEEKLWESYKETEARERAMRKVLAKTTKTLISTENQLDLAQRQLKDEQGKVRQLMGTKAERLASAKAAAEGRQHGHREDKLKHVDVDIEKLLHELEEKTQIIEEMVRLQFEKKALEEKQKKQEQLHRNPAKPRLSTTVLKKLEALAESRKISSLTEAIQEEERLRNDAARIEVLNRTVVSLKAENSNLKRKLQLKSAANVQNEDADAVAVLEGEPQSNSSSEEKLQSVEAIINVEEDAQPARASIEIEATLDDPPSQETINSRPTSISKEEPSINMLKVPRSPKTPRKSFTAPSWASSYNGSARPSLAPVDAKALPPEPSAFVDDINKAFTKKELPKIANFVPSAWSVGTPKSNPTLRAKSAMPGGKRGTPDRERWTVSDRPKGGVLGKPVSGVKLGIVRNNVVIRKSELGADIPNVNRSKSAKPSKSKPPL